MAIWVAFSVNKDGYLKQKRHSFKHFAIDQTWRMSTTICKYNIKYKIYRTYLSRNTLIVVYQISYLPNFQHPIKFSL